MDAIQIFGTAATLAVGGAGIWTLRQRASGGSHRLIALLLVLLTAVYGVSFVAAHAPEPLNWDEVDYINASELGIRANYLETGSLNLADFYRVGKLKGSGDLAAVQQLGRTLPPEAADPFTLRHFHPPLATYFWNLWGRLGTSETHWHSAMIFVLALGLLVTAFAAPRPSLISASAAAIAFTAPAVISGYQFLSFHEWHTPALVAFMALLFAAARAPSRRLDIALGIAASVLLLTLEMGAIVLALAIVALIGCGRWRYFVKLPALARIIGSGAVTLLLLWPGFYLKGGTFKAVAMYAYRLFVKHGQEYESVAAPDFWAHLIASNPVLIAWCVLGVVLTVYGLWTRRLSHAYLVPLAIGGGYAAIMTPFALRDAYMAPALVALAANTAFAITGLASASDRTSSILGGVALFTASLSLLIAFISTPFSTQLQQSRGDGRAMAADVAQIRRLVPADRPVLAVGAHMVSRYVPGYSAQRADAIGTPVQLYERRDYADIPATDSLTRGRFGAIVLWRASEVSPDLLQRLSAQGYRHVQLHYFDLALAPPR